MKIKKLLALCLVIAALLALPGCQLAREEAGEENPGKDRLIGVLITREYLDLFDVEEYVADHLGDFAGREIGAGDAEAYQGRIYASFRNPSQVYEETGEAVRGGEYVFEGLNGIRFFAPVIAGSSGQGDYTTFTAEEGISDTAFNLFSGDTEEKTELKGTIYCVPSGRMEIYCNPVYQTEAGGVYVCSGQGFIVDGIDAEGNAFSQTLDETTTITQNGESKTASTAVTVEVSIMFPPEKIVVLEIGRDHGVLGRTEYEPGTLPEAIHPKAGTDYILVETYKRDPEGKEMISRELVTETEGLLKTYYARPDGICVAKETELNWP